MKGGVKKARNDELLYENEQYTIAVVLLPGETLRVEAEQKCDGALWHGNFTSRYIEDVTQKTGNFKRFSVFVKMLQSAIHQDSDCVFVNLLTYNELEVLRARKTKDELQTIRHMTTNKRYLILTYVGEFDRVHYPLPLMSEDNSEPDILKRMIKRLKLEVENLKLQLHEREEIMRTQDDSTRAAVIENSELKRLKKENMSLQAQLRCFEELLGKGNYSYHEKSREMEEERNKILNDLAVWQNKYSNLLSKYESQRDCHKDIQILRRRLEQIQERLKEENLRHKNSVANLSKENAALTQEVKHAKESERKLRIKVRECESELDHLRRRMKLPSCRDLPPCRSRIRETARAAASLSNSRRPSPSSLKGSRPSSCPTLGLSFHKRVATDGDKGLMRTKCSIPLAGKFPLCDRELSRKLGLHNRRALQPDANLYRPKPLSTSSSISYRPLTPPLQKFNKERSSRKYVSESYGASPGKDCDKLHGSWRIPNHSFAICTSDDEPQGRQQTGSREDSPGRLLQEVREKLARFGKVQGLDFGNRDFYQLTRTTIDDMEANDSLSSLGCGEDIDARIDALQNFLHDAKKK
ncbi:hypothetical protein O6H91_04G106700 [Diphasiastrum complanatum]|uniref:Uncharacterized protein n=1 Tax=Diphasiastrum complanatum TaxID=34168 RepID=A0ACC2E0C1_DIPCM|nr:hypothetical protein O6H91_04G106700 [Diphasiastrum complanatum]